MKTFIFTILLLMCFYTVNAQNDTVLSIVHSKQLDYYTDKSKHLTFKPYISYKHNTLRINHHNETIILKPNSPIGIGMGFNCKYGGIALGLGLPQSKHTINKYGKTKRLDLQLNLFRKNIGLDGHFQLYKGYYFDNPNDFSDENKSSLPQLPEMRSISIGTSVYYVFNNEKYSNKAAGTRTQIQNISAGSLLSGLFFTYDEVDSPTGFLPDEITQNESHDFDLKAFRYFATGISFGYAYTYVISKQVFINGSAITGGGYKHVRVTNSSGVSEIERDVHGQITLRLSLGYEHLRFFGGLNASTLIRSMEYKNYNMDLATEQIRLFIGKRF